MFLNPTTGSEAWVSFPTVHRLTGSFPGNVDACTYHLIPNPHTLHEGRACHLDKPTQSSHHLQPPLRNPTWSTLPACFAVCTAVSERRILAHLFLILFPFPSHQNSKSFKQANPISQLKPEPTSAGRQLWAAATLCKRASILYLQTRFKIYLASSVALAPDFPIPSAMPHSLYKPSPRP